MRIACVGAHPDDVELSMGGSILLFRSLGHEVLLIDLTNGEPTPFGSEEIRKKESEKAALILDVKRQTLSFQNRFLFDEVQVRKELAKIFREFQPTIIFTHYEYDIHPDHIAASKITEGARFYSKLTKSDIQGEPFFPSQIVYYFPNHTHINLMPSFCIDITQYISKKKEVLKCYESQFLKKGKGEVIEKSIAVNRYYGIRIQTEYAEPFFLRETINLNFFSNLLTQQEK
ncbi:MAG: PIG-L family deacetylase [Leptospiraceae bacterium]|nr:PIG-L family deacetylase [Leptospiraceae bacterium]